MYFIKINGIVVPGPDRYPKLTVTSATNGARNSSNKFVGQKVGRDNYKIDNLQWSRLDAKTWSMILKECDKFEMEVEFPDMVNNAWRKLKMYPGDRSAQPDDPDEITSLPRSYKECKVNIIDMGW